MSFPLSEEQNRNSLEFLVNNDAFSTVPGFQASNSISDTPNSISTNSASNSGNSILSNSTSNSGNSTITNSTSNSGNSTNTTCILNSTNNSTSQNNDSFHPTDRHRLSKDGSRLILRRQGKPHVSSACLHCRNSHLACDKNRPCNRCISSGKADDCYDTQHKKRGRPKTAIPQSKDSSFNQIGKDIGSVALAAVCFSYQPSDSQRLSSPYLPKRPKNKRLTPLLPLFEPQLDSRQYLDLLYPRNNIPSPPSSSSSQLQSCLTLYLNLQGLCLTASCECDFMGLDLTAFPDTNLTKWFHPVDHNALAQAFQEISASQSISDVPYQVRVHLIDGFEQYRLVDMHLSSGERPGEIEARIFKFDLDTLLRLAPPGDLSLFM